MIVCRPTNTLKVSSTIIVESCKRILGVSVENIFDPMTGTTVVRSYDRYAKYIILGTYLKVVGNSQHIG